MMENLIKWLNLLDNRIVKIIGISSLAQVFMLVSIAILKVLRPERNLKRRQRNKKWAIVTGSTDGIGLEFCHQLAKRGFSILMLARNEQKMKDRIAELRKTSESVDYAQFVLDFKEAYSSKIFDQLESSQEFKQASESLALLVNNVGVWVDHKVPMQEQIESVIINCVPQAALTRMCLPQLKQKGYGGVVNLSSVLGLYPIMGIYSAAKAFNQFLSSATRSNSRNLDVMSVHPGFVNTPLLKDIPMKNRIGVVTTESCVTGTLQCLSWGDSFSFGSHRHSIFMRTFMQLRYTFRMMIVGLKDNFFMLLALSILISVLMYQFY